MVRPGWRRALGSTFRKYAAALAFVGVGLLPCAAGAGASSVLPLETILAGYRSAIADPGAVVPRTLRLGGTIAGAGLTGAFTSWSTGDRERTDENLGPRSDRTLRIGETVWYSDENGDVRRFTGVFARRERTQRFIESGAFADHPERCILRGLVKLGSLRTYALDVTQDGGETETLYLDATTFLPDELAYDDDDGRTTIDYADWRTVGGRRYAFADVTSDGDHAFDTTQRTTSVDPQAMIPSAAFAPLPARAIEMDAPETIALQEREGHFYAPVRIAGKAFTFLLDTGAQDIVLDRGVAAALGLPSVGALEASGAARTGGLGLAKVPALVVGTRGIMSNLVVTTLDLGSSTDGAFRIDGVLGYPFFASSLVAFDPAARSLTFGPPQSAAAPGTRIELSTDRGFPEATFRLNGSIDAPLIIDTGNAAELLLYHPFVERHAGIVPYSTTVRSSYGIGGTAASYRASLDQLDIGDIPLYHVETDVMLATRGAFADRFDAGNVGLGVLRNFKLTFDFAHDAMYVERGSTFDDGRTRN